MTIRHISFADITELIVIVVMKYLLTFFALVIALQIQAQESTTFILVRHAEKATDDPKDPNLTKEGELRALELMELLSQSGISAIYSTPYKRTRKTVEPISGLLKLEIMEYVPNDPKSLATEWISKHKGATILISGHSNTTPIMANALIGEEKYSQFNDADHGNILIITIPPTGKASHFILRY